MSYDEVINVILKRYNGFFYPSWVMTDSDSAQMRLDRRDGSFEFVELLETADEKVVLLHDVICLNDYSADDLWYYGSSFYDDRAAFLAMDKELIAECVFEGTAFNIEESGTPEEMLESYLKIIKDGSKK